MKRAGKITAIILISAAVLYSLYILVLNSLFSGIFSNEYLSKEEITNVVTQNIKLLNKAPNEIKNIDNTPFYIDVKQKYEIAFLMIIKSPYHNRVICHPVNPDYSKKNPYEVIKNDILSEILRIKGIQGIERYYSQSGRLCILFDCGTRSYMSRYYGFYYTEDNMPIGWEGTDVNFEQYENGWVYKDKENYGTTYITERITDNWFYFEVR